MLPAPLKKPLVRNTLAALTGLVGGALVLGWFERRKVEITRKQIALDLGPESPKSLRIALLSDFHFDPLHETEFADRWVALANEEKPDLALLLGDFVSDSARQFHLLADRLADLQAPLGTYAILGNHDFWSDPAGVIRDLDRVGIPVLRNEIRHIDTGDGELALAGLESVWGGRPDPDCIRSRGNERFILAMHEPDYVDHLPIPNRVALQVSGHTHGGQICPPSRYPLHGPVWGMRYRSGHFYSVETDTHLYVTRGLGTVRLHSRIFCPPEVAILDLHNTARMGIPEHE